MILKDKRTTLTSQRFCWRRRYAAYLSHHQGLAAVAALAGIHNLLKDL